MGYTLPMFPLSNVVFPYMLLPLHIFEDRYRALMADLQDVTEPEFGVVLIERGWEVGGGEERAEANELDARNQGRGEPEACGRNQHAN